MSWAAQAERGSPWLARTAVALGPRLPWVLARMLTLPVTLWFLLSSRRARQASRDYLRRVLGRPAGWGEVARHFDQFACALLDRVAILAGRDAGFAVEVEGLEALQAVLRPGGGAILLGAHLGSFEVLRSLARNCPVPVWALMYRRNGGSLTALLDQIAPSVRERILEIGDTASMIRARECVDRGEIVGILADRSPPGHRSVAAPFLGSPAPFPSGPFVLAACIGAPVFLFHGVRTAPRRYRVGIEPFADRILLRREQRAADLGVYVGRYAAALERTCRRYPFQWFNFFPFWECDDARPGPRPAPAHPAHPTAARHAAPRPG